MKKIVTILLFVISISMILIFSKDILRTMYPIKFQQYIEKYSQIYDLDKYLVASVIKAESNFDTDATSLKNARGLMQITPSTGEWIAEQMNLVEFSPEKLYDPEQNIFMGCWYIDNLRKEFNNNYLLILSAYNAGRGNVNKWLKNPDISQDGQTLNYIPFKETELYVKKINLSYNIYKYVYDKKK